MQKINIMQTFILRNGNNQDVQLLLDISRKLGLDLELQSPFFSDKTRMESVSQAIVALTQTRKTHNFSEQDIVDECRKVRAELQK